MKHIKFTFAEPIIGIQYVHNEVFVGGSWQLCVADNGIAQRLRLMLMDLQIPLKPKRIGLGGYNEIRLDGGFYFTFINDEIFVMHGNDDIYVEDELGNRVTNCNTHLDWDIDENYYSTCK